MSLSACGLKHVDELILLKQYGDEVDAQSAEIDAAEASFLSLLKDEAAGEFGKGLDQRTALARYGEPTYIQTIEPPGETAVLWMYRRPVHFFDSDQVLLYFNKEGQLVSHMLKRYEPESGE